MKPTLYIPVETAARELDGKLLLSLFAVEKGFPVVLGNRALMSNALHGFEPGVFLSHNFDKGRRRILRIARDLGFTTVGWDEEGLVWVSPEIYRSRRVDAGAVETLGAIYAWGEEHAAALAPVTEPARVRVVKAGNPRADLLRPELRGLYEGPVGALRSELGRFILINSNFGWLNYALGSGSSDAGGDGLQELARRSGHPEEFLRFRLDVFEAFVKALPRLARTFADRTIVVRPHPSEDPAVWESAAAGLKNVVVRYDHELIPWLLAADVIVHNGCTTAVEAAALGRAPIAFCPVHGGPHEIPQPRAVSLVAEDEETLLDLVASSPEPTAETTKNLGRMIASDSGHLAAELIARDLADIGQASAPERGGLKAQVRSRARSFQKSVSRLTRRSPSNPAYIAQKFPPTPGAELATRLAAFAGLLGRPAPRVEEVSDRIYRITSIEPDAGA